MDQHTDSRRIKRSHLISGGAPNMPLVNSSQRFLCRRCLFIISVMALVLNLVVFWPSVRTYTIRDETRQIQPLSLKNTEDVQPTKANEKKYVDSSPVKSWSGGENLKYSSFPQPNLVTQGIEIKTVVNTTMRRGTDALRAKTKDTSDISLPPCDKIPPRLIGPLAGDLRDIAPEKVLERHMNGSSEYSPMELGGRSRPLKCQAAQKLAIIIPYRNRFAHLHILLNNLIPFLRRQQIDFQIFVIEQNLPTVFNRGMLMNVGFLEALKLRPFNCFVFHDVDMIPLNDHCLYSCKDNPMHLAAWTSKFNGLPYGWYFGGVVMFSREQFQKINGDSNLYFGWGGEDDDLSMRVKKKGYVPVRYPQRIGRYKMIKHERDHGNAAGRERYKLLTSGRARIDNDGLTTTVYEVTRVETHPLYTWIHVSIDRDLVMKNLMKAEGITKDIVKRVKKKRKARHAPSL